MAHLDYFLVLLWAFASTSPDSRLPSQLVSLALAWGIRTFGSARTSRSRLR